MSSNRRKNIFVLGHDDRHSADLQRIPDADRFRIHPLLDSSEVIYQKHYDIQAKLDKARRILRDFDGPVDGIVCHWDFPATSMAAILCREFDLLFPSLEAILKSSHKYWSRLEQQKAAPECTPDFCALDPFDDNAEDNITLDFPFWLKPVKAYGSALGFRIDNREDLKSALATVRNKIHRLGDAVDDILARAEVPPEVASVGGTWLICEQLVGGWELAPEGCIRHGKFSAHGTIDMVRAENQKVLPDTSTLQQLRTP